MLYYIDKTRKVEIYLIEISPGRINLTFLRFRFQFCNATGINAAYHRAEAIYAIFHSKIILFFVIYISPLTKQHEARAIYILSVKFTQRDSDAVKN